MAEELLKDVQGWTKTIKEAGGKKKKIEKENQVQTVKIDLALNVEMKK
eukprot:CAMPEP_0202963808 /NCGR_PEP_ID=MMETSP1396-20130829/7832_1 /ASSEMBLY_ACC=CAM_ASM_000872 /TAXON_ID= /ORGANISM="Pseudokeronopsis sp., Strain Brazil" /LENGTH=47 /DNA_ID= /DNA_START= /DNA_END= /DNA_ORIENTATION=